MTHETLPEILGQADTLANALPQFMSRIGPASSSQMGAARRRRAGSGESFWQYRQHTPEDGATRIDWRKSARGDDLFVRDNEMETPRNFLFWCDGAPGFRWRGQDTTPTKFARALTIQIALAKTIGKAGDKIGMLGGDRPSSIGQKSQSILAKNLFLTPEKPPFPPVNNRPATLIIASDFYQPLVDIEAWLINLSTSNTDGVLLMTVDPIEETYPYEGRIDFFTPDKVYNRLIGRAETLKDEYLAKFQERCHHIQSLAHKIGWHFEYHSTANEALPALANIAFHLQQDRVMS